MGQRMGHAGAVADDIQPVVLGHQVLVEVYLHVIELDLHAVEQGVVVRGARGDLVKRVYHLDDIVEDALGQDKAQVAWGGLEGRAYGALFDAVVVGAPAALKVAEALYDHTAAQHIAEHRDALAVAVAVLKGHREVL